METAARKQLKLVKLTKKQAWDICQEVAFDLKKQGEADEDIKVFFCLLLERRYNPENYAKLMAERCKKPDTLEAKVRDRVEGPNVSSASESSTATSDDESQLTDLSASTGCNV
jgi:hypothetical protein